MSEEAVQQVEELPQPDIKGKELLKRLAGKVSINDPGLAANVAAAPHSVVTKGWILVYKYPKSAFRDFTYKYNGRYLTAKGELLSKLKNAQVFLVRKDATAARSKAKASYHRYLRIVQIIVTISLKTRKPRRKKNENP